MPVFNAHNKEEFPPAHTAEHLLNQTMMRMFGCGRAAVAHIERKKSKMDFILDNKPQRKDEKAIEDTMNRLIEMDMPVTCEYVKLSDLTPESTAQGGMYEGVNIDRLPEEVSDTICLVRIGDYDVCPCIGKHVRSTAQIGKFALLGTSWDEHKRMFRVRYKIV